MSFKPSVATSTWQSCAAYRVDRPPVALLSELACDLSAIRASDSAARFAAIRISPGSAYADIARWVEAAVFKDAWYREASPREFARQMGDEYEPYDGASRFLLLIDRAAFDEAGLPRLAGMARLSGGAAHLLKTVRDVPEVWPVTVDDVLADALRHARAPSGSGDAVVWDFSSLAVLPAYRRTTAYPALSHHLYRWSLEHGARVVTTILVKGFFDLYRRVGVPFRALCDLPAREHLGALSVPAVMLLDDVPGMAGHALQRVREAHRLMVEGHGLGSVSLQAPNAAGV